MESVFSDHLVIATDSSGTIRIYTVLTTGVVEEARLIHGTWPTATAALGRVLSGTLMMGVMSDTLSRLTVHFDGQGPLGRILAVSNRRGAVKGYVENPQTDLDLNRQGKLDVGGAIGPGTLTVIKDYGLKTPYHGVVPIQNGEVGLDLAYYFNNSEQTPTAVGLGVLVLPDGQVKAAGGFIVQLLPGYTETSATFLERQLHDSPATTSLLDSGVSPLELAKRFVPDRADFKELETMPVFYRCDCSRERFRNPLASLGLPELESIIREQGRIEVRCQFCNQVYHFLNVELE